MRKLLFYIILFLSLTILIDNIQPIMAVNDDVNLLVVSSAHNERLSRRLGLESNYNVVDETKIPNSLDNFSCIVLFDYNPISSSELIFLESYRGGIIILMGPNLTKNASLLVSLGLTTSVTGEVIASKALPVPTEGNKNHPILRNIEWNSIPTISNYSNIPLAGLILLETSVDSENPGLPLMSIDNNKHYSVLNIWPDEELNKEFVQWPYFNYFLYVTIQVSIEKSPLKFADWPYSPVPHISETIFLGFMVLVVGTITITGFQYARKYAENNPLIEKELSEIAKEVKSVSDWEEIGMHRQLGGFLVQLFIGIVILLPNVIMTALVFPLVILPSPQAAGFYDFTVHFFEAIWLLFDLGSATAMVKFFAEHRVKRPQYALRFVQIFIWYQMISGIMQLFLVSFLGSIIFPRIFLAHMSWVFVTHAFFQWPAFFLVFMLIFRAMNRIDLHQIINLLLYAVFNITLQYLVIIIFRVFLGSNLIFGDALAGAIGYSVGNYVIQWTTFLVSLWIFKRLGFSVISIFRVDFTWEEIKAMLKFGSKWVLGYVLPPLGWFWQVFLLSTFLPNYTQQQGYFAIAWSFALIVQIVGLFAEGILGGISESYHAGRKKLTQYYAVSSLKWAAFFDFFFVAALMAVGPRFILGGAGVEWSGAAILIPWLLIFHAFGYLSWLGDWMFAGSDRPGWAALSWIIEQGLRAILLILFIPIWEFFSIVFGSPLVAVMFAYIPALIIKNIFMWYVIRRNEYFKFRWHDLLHQGIIAPIFSAIILFSILEVIFSFIWKGEIITSIIILIIGVILGLYFYAFVYGLLGGFDDGTLSEFKRAIGMAKGVWIFTKPLWQITALGARLSPLHNKFPISIFDEAQIEAKSLTEEKKELVI
jgi:O-antigen/teichoic acid export membrane protein